MEPVAHAEGIRQFVRFAQAEGVPLSPAFDPALLAAIAAPDGPEHVPAREVIDGLQRCAEAAGRCDLGAAFAVWADLRGYGPLSHLTGHCHSVRDALAYGLRYMHLVNGALTTVIEEDGTEAAVRRMSIVSGRHGCDQFMESVLMSTVRMMRAILGEPWTPLRVEFAHRAPGDIRAHARLFRAPLMFNAERYAVVLSREDMNRPAPAGDPGSRATVEGRIRALDGVWPQDFTDVVQRATARALALGDASLGYVARSLSLGPRTVQRRLTQAGSSFADVLAQVRVQIAEDYLRSAEHPSLTDLAYRLGYGDASAASRFLRTRLGLGVRTCPQRS